MPDDDILLGWKAIAAYLGTSERTAKRYGSERQLPVQHPPNGTVLASKRALDEWRVKPIRNAILVGNQLTAVDAQGETVWTRTMPGSLRIRSNEDLSWRVRVLQMPGQTKPGILIACGFSNTAAPDAIVYFRADGTEAWSTPAVPDLLDRNGHRFESAWRYTDMAIASAGEIWASVANDLGWAGCVLRMDARGEAALHFANAGHVERVSVLESAPEDMIVACGENNDFDQAFAASFKASEGPCRSVPGQRKVYQYGNAPLAYPRKYILFPRTELIEAVGKPYGHVQGVRRFPGRIVVHVETGDQGQFLYHFSEDLEPEYVFPSGSHEGLHRRLEAAGRVDHAWIDCPELTRPLELRVWEAHTGWREATIPWRDNPWKEI